MKTVVSVSLGSSDRDHAVEVDMLGERMSIARRGCDGDFARFVHTFRELDGTVDALGVGGAEFYMEVNGRRYHWKQLREVRAAVTRSKLADGNGVKHLLEPMAIAALKDAGVDLRGKRALMMAAVDRYGLARALVDAGCQVRFGDFGSIGLPITVPSLGIVEGLAVFVLPILSRMPFSVVYPVGDKDKPPEGVLKKHAAWAEVIAGDFLQIQQNLPPDLTGKIVVTNTTTDRDVQLLRERGLHLLVTTTPPLEGRSFGTNVMEACCRALIDKPDAEITPEDLRGVLDRIPIRPLVRRLNA